jgi:hypothetical protein
MLKAFIYDESFCKLCKKIPPDHFYRWMKPVFVGHYKNLEYKVLEYWGVCEKCVSQRPFYHRQDRYHGEIKLVSISREEFETNQLITS